MNFLNDKEIIKPINKQDRTLIKNYFIEKQTFKKMLSKEEKKYVNYFLKNYKEWRDVLFELSQKNLIEQGELMAQQPSNNTDYKPTLKKLGVVASFAIIFFTMPQIDHQFNTPSFKGFVEEKGLIDETIEYWESLFEKFFWGGE